MAGACTSRPGANRDDGADPGARPRRARVWTIAGPSLIAACVATSGAARPVATDRPATHAADPVPALRWVASPPARPPDPPPAPRLPTADAAADRREATVPGGVVVADRVGDAPAGSRPAVDPSPRPERLQPPTLRGPVTRVAFLGDSLIADWRLLSPGADRNDVVARIEAALRDTVGAVEVENLGRPGQSLVFVREDFRRHDRGITTLRAAVQTFFADRPIDERPQLAVIATTGIDVNVMADLPIEVLAPILVDALAKTVDDLAELGIQAVLLPIFPVADAVHDRHGGAVRGTEARVEEVNARLARSGLPVLFERFEGLDVDGRPGSDAEFYARSSPDHPDDGVHPGPAGREVYVDNVVGSLVPALGAANAPEPPPVPLEVARA